MSHRTEASLLVAAAFALFISNAAAQTPKPAAVRGLPSPAAAASGQPSLFAGPRGRVYLSWVERLAGKRFALRFSAREGAGWSPARTVAEGENWFVNWADFPSVVALPDGSLAAHWLVRRGAGVYSYDVKVSRSFDGGLTWAEPLTPHRDGTESEHGFVSMFPAPGPLLGAVWLDGREMKQPEGGGHGEGHAHGSMTLRYAAVARDGRLTSEQLLDARVCECCQTSAATTSEGTLVVYRDRSDKEVRDIYYTRLTRDGRWSEPRAVHADGWRLDGCPVNGPSVAARGRHAAVAWFTMADGSPRVRVAFSKDAGATFGPPVGADDGDPLGRADVLVLEDGSAVVCWLERTKDGAEVRARRLRPDGTRGPSLTVAAPGASRSSGFPQMAPDRGRLLFAWTSPQGVMTAEADVPR
ncbi:MAG TPA: sialidase family protein [Pyrinomonadaceae bacterium]|jgi:hypothetical protein|nr:sialidase family protein [Pyrinomonadaceae bacterium]